MINFPLESILDLSKPYKIEYLLCLPIYAHTLLAIWMLKRSRSISDHFLKLVEGTHFKLRPQEALCPLLHYLVDDGI